MAKVYFLCKHSAKHKIQRKKLKGVWDTRRVAYFASLPVGWFQRQLNSEPHQPHKGKSINLNLPRNDNRQTNRIRRISYEIVSPPSPHPCKRTFKTIELEFLTKFSSHKECVQLDDLFHTNLFQKQQNLHSFVAILPELMNEDLFSSCLPASVTLSLAKCFFLSST